jgi:hypothetical protein
MHKQSLPSWLLAAFEEVLGTAGKQIPEIADTTVGP